MDPMDFTMDDGQGSQQQNHAANQYHCQGSLPYYHPNGNPSPRGMSVRGEGQQYDPVHDNSGSTWYHGGPSIPNNPPAHHISYPHSEQTFGGGYHNQYAPIHDNPHMRNLAYQYMGGHEGVGSSAWMDRAGHQNQYPHTAYYNYPSAMMNANSNPNGQNPPVSQAPTTLGNHNPHMMAQRQEYQAAQVNQENIRNRVSGSFNGVPPPPPVSQEHRIQQQPRPLPQRSSSISAAGLVSNYASTSSRPAFPFERAETSSLRHERAIAAQHRATLAAATASTVRSRALRASAGYSDDDDDDDLSPGNSPGRRYRHTDQYLLAAEHQDARMMAAVRGAMSEAMSAERDRVKVPSKAALASMVKLTLDEVKADPDHKEKELFCIICYNNFGEANPEGIVESILMLPKCKHIFGHICIKEWFLNHDTCPYCRDQLPSESSHRRSAALEQYRILQERSNHNDQSRLALARARSTLAYRSAAADASATFAPAGENNVAQGAVESLFAPHSRSFSHESPDRRRPNRGRPNGRPNQPVFSRTTPTGSARPQRVAHTPGAPVMAGTYSSFTGSPYRAIPTGPSNESSSGPANQISTPVGHEVASESSPAVVDGSFAPAGDHMPVATVFAPALSAEINQPRHASSSTPVFSAATRPSLGFGAVDQQNGPATTSGNIPRESMNSVEVSPVPHSGNDPARYAAQNQPNGNAPPLPLPPNFRPRWTR